MSLWNGSQSPSPVFYWCFSWVVLFTAFNKIGDGIPVFHFIPLWYTSNNGYVIRELLEVTAVGVVSEVWHVQSEKERGEHCTADCHIRHTIMKYYILWSVSEGVDDPCRQVAVYICLFQFLLQQWCLYCVESTGKVKRKNMTLTVTVNIFPTNRRDCCQQQLIICKELFCSLPFLLSLPWTPDKQPLLPALELPI